MNLKQESLKEIIIYLKKRGHNLNKFILKYNPEKQTYIFYLK